MLALSERQALENVVRRGKTSQRLSLRARMILMRADGMPIEEIARNLFVHRNRVRRWCDRYQEKRFTGLFDRPRSGRPRALSLESKGSLLWDWPASPQLKARPLSPIGLPLSYEMLLPSIPTA